MGFFSVYENIQWGYDWGCGLGPGMLQVALPSYGNHRPGLCKAFLWGWYLGAFPVCKQAVSQCQSQIKKNGLNSMHIRHVRHHMPEPWRFSMGWQNPSLSRYWWSLQWWPPTCWIQLGSPGAVDWNTVLANPAISGEKLGMVKLALPHEIWCSSLLGVYTSMIVYMI